MTNRVLPCVLFLLAQTAIAQNFGAGVSTLHDANIFDTYAPIDDQITQVNLDASKDWDLDQTSLGLGYYGSMLFYNAVSERTYHIHSALFSFQYQFYREDEDPDSSGAENDSSGAVAALNTPPAPVAHIDSLDQFLYTSIGGIAQFNKTEFSDYDNSAVIASVSFRQPIVEAVSLRPGYSMTYHAYPNLPGLANFQHVGMLTLGISLLPNGWLGVTGAAGHEQYTESTSFTYTYSDSVPGGNGFGHAGGHGKGSSGGTGTAKSRTLTFDFTTPSVDQLFFGAVFHQKIASKTDLTAQGTVYAPPSSGARIIPERIQNAVENRPGTFEGFGTQTDIFDDHFTYSGSEFLLQLRQPLPVNFQATIGGVFRHKRFTSPATGILGDTLAPNRLDDRFEGVFALSRPFPIFSGRTMNLVGEVHYVRNQSNEPFYDFKKTVLMVGLQMSF